MQPDDYNLNKLWVMNERNKNKTKIETNPPPLDAVNLVEPKYCYMDMELRVQLV
jgi:hypothetical protein